MHFDQSVLGQEELLLPPATKHMFVNFATIAISFLYRKRQTTL
jgi:hypothetical protein